MTISGPVQFPFCQGNIYEVLENTNKMEFARMVMKNQIPLTTMPERKISQRPENRENNEITISIDGTTLKECIPVQIMKRWGYPDLNRDNVVPNHAS